MDFLRGSSIFQRHFLSRAKVTLHPFHNMVKALQPPDLFVNAQGVIIPASFRAVLVLLSPSETNPVNIIPRFYVGRTTRGANKDSK